MAVREKMTKIMLISCVYWWALSAWIVLTVHSICQEMTFPDKVCIQICRGIGKCYVPKSLKLYEDSCYCQVNESGMGEIGMGILQGELSTQFDRKGSRSRKTGHMTDHDKLRSTHKESISRTGRRSTYANHLKNITLHTEYKNWLQAQEACENDGGTLVKLDSEQKHGYVGRLVKATKKPAWIGLRDIYGNDTWFWKDGSPLTKPMKWNFLEPQNRQGEDCVGIKVGMLAVRAVWFDNLCNVPYQYICER